MNRKERRNLKKDKDLIKELYSIIVKYLPKLLDKFENLTDIRNKSYVTYKMKTICVTRLFGLLCGLTTMTDISSNDFNTNDCIKNLSKICGQNLEEIPYWETIQDVFINIKTKINNIIDKNFLIFKLFINQHFRDYFTTFYGNSKLINLLQRKGVNFFRKEFDIITI